MASALGPVLTSTLNTSDYEGCLSAWCNYLAQKIHLETRLSSIESEKWSASHLTGSRVAWLENDLGEPWLRIIEDPSAKSFKPFSSYGWLSLEICVEDVDAIYRDLRDSPFKIIGPPADLDVSPDIRAMQVVGPAKEILYLTQIKAHVPGFELPFARCRVDRLFIPVLVAENWENALSVYTSFPQTNGMPFETKITVLNRYLEFPAHQRHPVATIQLSGENLIEIDQVTGLESIPGATRLEREGITVMTFALRDFFELTDSSERYIIPNGPFAGKSAVLLRGSSNENIELMEFDPLMELETRR